MNAADPFRTKACQTTTPQPILISCPYPFKEFVKIRLCLSPEDFPQVYDDNPECFDWGMFCPPALFVSEMFGL
jgi:hypothetical protein